MTRDQPPSVRTGSGDAVESTFCTGEACGVISVRWDPAAGSYLVLNRSDRLVRVHFQTWPSTTDILLPPGSQASLHAKTLEYPYCATYEPSSQAHPG